MNTALLSTRLAFGCGLLVAASIAFAAPPSITQQPGVAVVTSGSPASFTVGASAAAPLSYQWRHLGEPLANGTGPTLMLPSVTMADAGLYDVVVTAGGESTVSQAARLITTPAQYADQFCLDDSFLPLIETTGASAEVVAADPITGGFYVGGEFSTIDGGRRWNLARFDSAGTLDPSFTPQVDGNVLTITVQSDGKVLIGGAFRFVNNVQRGGIARLNTDGSLDRTFGNNRGFDGEVIFIGLQSTGRIVAYSNSDFDGISPPDGIRLIRLLPNGIRDSTFTVFTDPFIGANGGFAIDHQDRILFLPRWFNKPMVRALPDGAEDVTFTPPSALGTIYAFDAQSDGIVAVVVTGGASVIRLKEDGGKDPGYIVPLTHVSEFDPARIAIDAQDRALVYDPFDRKLIRILPAGSIDPTFIAPEYLPTTDNENSITPLPASGRIVVVGGHGGGMRLYNSDGALNRAASADFFRHSAGVAAALSVQNGSWLIAGSFSRIGGSQRNGIARILPDGALDPAFGPPVSGGEVSAIARQGDGKILLARRIGPIAVERLLADGSPDPGFDADDGRWFNTPSALELQPDGKILVGGDTWLNRFNSDGSADPTFVAPVDPFPAPYNSRMVSSITVLSDGRVLAGKGDPGHSVYGVQSPYLRRLLANGAIDPSFNTTSDFNDPVRTVVPLPNGDILVGGYFTYFGTSEAACVARLNADGLLTQGPAFAEIGAGVANAVLWMPDNRVVLSGKFSTGYWGEYNSTLRLKSDGTRDTAFQVSNLGSSPTAAARFDDSGRLLYSGATAARCGLGQYGLARLKPGIAPEPRIVRSPVTTTFVHPGAGTALQIQAAGADLHYQWYKDGVAIPGSDSATLSISATTFADSGRYHAEASNSYGTVISAGADLAVTTETHVSYDDWAAAEGLVDGDAYDDADPEGDGVSNFLHYALKTGRGTGSTGAQRVSTVSADGATYLAITFTRKAYATDVRYHVEATSDLTAWSWEEVQLFSAGTPAEVTVRDTTPVSATSRRFLRVRVERVFP